VSQVTFVNLLFLGGLLLFCKDAPVKKSWARFIAVAILEIMIGTYLAWRWTRTLPPFSWEPADLWPWVFFGCEAYMTIYTMWSLLVCTKISDHTPEADAYEAYLRALPPEQLPTVDVFIPTYTEKREILELTIQGALALEWPKDKLKIYLLDDSRRGWLKDLCAHYGVEYIARPTNEHGKAGNLNYAFARTTGDYVVGIDADFIFDPRFILRTVGFLTDRPRLGLVQVPQHFRNPDPIQHNLGGSAAWCEEQNFFMAMVEACRDAHGNAFCVGSNWVVRRATVAELGGFAQQTMCEDLEMTYALKAKGYQTLFLNEALAWGLAAESVPEYLKQRVRWCSGTFQHLYIDTGPFRNPRLSLLDRLMYLETAYYWSTYPFIVLMTAAPFLFWFFGVCAMKFDDTAEVMLMLAPRFFAGFILTYWMSEGKVMPPVSMVHSVLGSFHLAAAVIKAQIDPFGSPWKVTTKGEARNGIVIQWGLMSLFLVQFVVLLAGMLMNLTGFYEVVPFNHLTWLDVCFTCIYLMLLFLCCLVCVEYPKDISHTTEEVHHGRPLLMLQALGKRLFC
jgi:cellulose synthase (UDP-forming)